MVNNNVNYILQKKTSFIQYKTHKYDDAELPGVCLPEIPSVFPFYELKQVKKDIIKAYREQGHNPSELPSLPSSIEGDIDIMLGIKYLGVIQKKYSN